MNKEQIVKEYQSLYQDLYTTLDKLKELMDRVDYQVLMEDTLGDEDLEMMYGDFDSLVDGIKEAYN